jgi:uncharacterized protein
LKHACLSVFFALLIAACTAPDKALENGGRMATVAPAPVSQPAATGYALPDTYVHQLPDPRSHRQYEVWVSLPPSYRTGARRYPVVFVTDAPYEFPVVHAIRARVGQSGQNIEDFILVGLSYDKSLTPKQSRKRDYTWIRGDADTSDGAAYYRDYVAASVLPFIATHYRADMHRTTLVGHSYGSLFGTYVLLTRPEMFTSYVLGSPSFWYEDGDVFRLEAAGASRRRDPAARVLMFAGEFETPGKGPRYYRTVDLVGDMQRFERRIVSRRYPALHIRSQVLPDEDHLTIFPNLATKGLLELLPGTGPYISG